MGFLFSTLSGVFKILSEAFKIFFRSGKTLISIALLSCFTFYTLRLSEKFISTKPLVSDFPTNINQTNIMSFDLNTTSGFEKGFAYMADNISYVVGHYIDSMKDVKGWALSLARSLAYLFLAVATILVSTAKHCSAIDLQIGDLISLIAKSWERGLVTLIYKKIIDEFLVALFVTPYIVSVLGKSIVAFFLSFFILVVVSPIFFYYISIVCNLGLVVSVLEKKSGFEALSKASKLVKGSKLKAFLLSIVFDCALSLLRQLSDVKKVEFMAISLNSMVDSVADVLWFISFTILYCECKKIHGQEVGNEVYKVKYAKLPVLKSL